METQNIENRRSKSKIPDRRRMHANDVFVSLVIVMEKFCSN